MTDHTDRFIATTAARLAADITRLMVDRGLTRDAAIAAVRDRTVAGPAVWAVVLGGDAMTRYCKNPIVSETEIRLFCGKPLTRVGVDQYVCRSCLARVAGSTTSDRKKASSAANGRKGGRPRKVQP